jgi:hypothetical protein
MFDVLGNSGQAAAPRQAEGLVNFASHCLPALPDARPRPESARASAATQTGGRVVSIDPLQLAAFIRATRSMIGRSASSPFSLDDVYLVAQRLGLNGVLFLEKRAENRHVTVLLEVDACQVLLYDPWLGIKAKSCNETHFGMYGKPVGSLRGEFERTGLGSGSPPAGDVWAGYAERGRRLYTFLQMRRGGVTFWRANTPGCAVALDLAAVQEATSPADCAPICLFVLSLLQPASTWGTRGVRQRPQPERCQYRCG